MLFFTLVTCFAATVLANPLHQHARFTKRACTTSDDTAATFLAYPGYSGAATNAMTPSGYINTFTNLHASNNAEGYITYTTLDSYDVASCAARCTSISSCKSFNILFERAPAPTSYNSTCSSSTATIKCVLWSGAVTPQNAVNTGSTTSTGFEIVIAGSNGYIAAPPNPTVSNPTAGYSTPVFLNNTAIQAPLDCNGQDTYLGFQFFDGTFDASKCAAACSAQSAYNLAHPPSNGSKPKTCQFFNIYQELKNGVSQGQKCVLYSQSWGVSVAKNVGYGAGNDSFTVGMSYAYSNATDAGVCVQG